MGTCQSQPERRRSRYSFDVDGGDIPLAKGGSRHQFQPIKSTSGVGRKSSVYDLQLISPSERTAATDALSPASIYSPTFTNVSPIKKENHFDFEIVEDENDQPLSYEKFDAFPSHHDANSFIDPEFTEIGIETGIGIEKDESFNFRDIPVLNSADLIHSLTKEYDFDERRQDEEDEIDFEYNFTDENFATLMAESDREAIVDYSSSKIENGFSDSFERDQVKASFEAPPLLAPPDDIPITLQPSSTYTAVDPAIYATFNKMQKEVSERKKHDKQRRREAKIKDRRKDLQGYRALWGEYSQIQKRITEERNNDFDSTSPTTTKGSKVSLANTSTWYVDFNALETGNYMTEVGAVDNSDTSDDDNHEKDETKLPFLLESSTFYSRHDDFGMEELWQRNIPRSNESVSKANGSLNSNMDAPESTTALQKDNESGSNENDERNSIPDAMDFESGSRSFVSDLDNGSNSSISSDIDRAFDTNDYGVLRRYNRKSIASTIPTEDQIVNQKSDENAQKDDRTRSSFTKHVVPSVSIETGLIRWRELTTKEKRVQATREMRIF